MINKKLNFIYVHVPKTGGVSIEKVFNSPIGDHRTVQNYIKLLGANKYAQYFSFAFVRNPWDKLVSNYFYDRQGGYTGKQFKYNADKISYKQWLLNLPQTNKDKKLYTNQIDWLTNFDDVFSINFLGKFENLIEDWKKISKILKVDLVLPHYNKTERIHYKNYYDDQETIDIVAKYHKKDIEKFKYTFEI